MNTFDIPIFQKTYMLYKSFCAQRDKAPKQHRYTIWQKCDAALIDILEGLLMASETPRAEKLPILVRTSTRLNMLRVFIRLLKDIGAIEMKQYIAFEAVIDEIGRMLGGWIRATQERTTSQSNAPAQGQRHAQ